METPEKSLRMGSQLIFNNIMENNPGKNQFLQKLLGQGIVRIEVRSKSSPVTVFEHQIQKRNGQIK